MGSGGQRWLVPGPGGRRQVLPTLAVLGGLVIVFAIGGLESPVPGVALLAAAGAGLGAVVVAAAGWLLAEPLPAPRRGAARVALLVVPAHLLLMLAHDAAHDRLGVGLSAAQMVFAILLIFLAPVLAAALLYTRWAAAGALLLAAAMAAALLFGIYWHYLAISPDHVAHLPPGDARGLFRLTAAGLVLSEAVGLGAGLWSWRRLRKSALPA